MEKKSLMKTIKVSLEIELTQEEIAYLLTAAIEGGSNQWYEIVDIVTPTKWEYEDRYATGDGKHCYSDYPVNPGGALIITDYTEDNFKPVKLDWERIQKGVEIMLKKCPHRVIKVIKQDYDAIDGDAFLQCCIFGEDADV